MVPIEKECVELIEKRYQEDVIKLKMRLCKVEEKMKEQDKLNNNNYYLKESVLNGRNE